MSESIASVYLNGDYVDRHPTYHAEDAPWKAHHVLSMLRSHSITPGTICEIGCGVGEILFCLQRSLPEQTLLTGYEVSPQAHRRCLERQNHHLHFHCADLLEQDAVEPFDLMLCLDVFEHVPDYMGFLRRLRTKAHHFIFHIPLDLSVQSILRGRPIMQTRQNLGHLHYFTGDTALATLKDTGYDIIDWSYTASGIDRGSGWRQAVARWPRRILAAMNRNLAARLLGGHSMLVLAQSVEESA